MKKNLSLLATLALAAALSPAVFAQQEQTSPPATDPQTQTAPAPGNATDTQAQTSFSGTVVKVQKHYALKTDSMTYQLDDQAKAKQFAGKQVTVSGTLDKSTSIIRVTDIQLLSS
jgi:lipopolysaccharide export system protein LptA